MHTYTSTVVPSMLGCVHISYLSECEPSLSLLESVGRKPLHTRPAGLDKAFFIPIILLHIYVCIWLWRLMQKVVPCSLFNRGG